MVKLENILMILTMIVLISSTVSLFYFYSVQENKCISNPLVFGAKQYLENSDATKVIGELKLFKGFNEPYIILFNDKK